MLKETETTFADILLQDFDIKDFMQLHGFPIKYIGGATVYLSTCPFCQKQEHLGINPNRRGFGCYRCHAAGDYLKLIGKVLDKNYFEVLEILKSGLSEQHVDVNRIGKILDDFKPYEKKLSIIKPIALPKEYVPLGDSRVPYLDYGRKFPVPQDQVRYYKMGMCYSGFYRDRLIICDVNEKQEPIYWIARDVTGKVPKKRKVLNPIADANSVGSSDLLFNISLAKNYKSAIITEGLFDALYIGNNGVASYGEGLKQSHIYWLLKAGFDEVILLYDADVPMERLEKSASLLSLYFRTRICKLPSGDPDEWERSKLAEFIDSSKNYIPSRLHELCPNIKSYK